MTLSPTHSDLHARALTDLRLGLPIVMDGPVPMLVCALETLTQSRLDALRTHGDVQIALTKWRANTLKIASYDGEFARIALPKVADATWCHAIADPTLDMRHPMKGPFTGVRDGDADVAGLALALAKSAHLLPAVLIVPQRNKVENLTHLPLEATVPAQFHNVVSAGLPLSVSQAGRVHVFRPDGAGEEHYAIEIGNPDRRKPVLTRLHSACFTGDVLGSLKCDCGPQLQAALRQMGEAGEGILLYLNQEGRGIGLANKMRAYALQAQGFDTVDANHRLGFEDDERDFRIGADLLQTLGFTQIRLLTNNPAKVDRLTAQGLQVRERVPLITGHNKHNENYLKTKATKSGHIL